jgi:hypothetical protein
MQRTALVLLIAALGASARSQEAPTALDFSAPVHRGSSSDGEALWASGQDYKVRFEADALAFVPVLGAEAPRSLPLRWRLEVPDGSHAERLHGAWHVEFHRGTLIERYDVLPHGLEQSFVLREKPALEGPVFELRGSIETELCAAPREPQHAALWFCDAHGAPVVSYGAAFAIDACGERIALDTAFDGSAIALRVPTSWLAQAAYPVTLDPLLSRASLQGSPSTVSSTATVRGAMTIYPFTERVLIAATRAVSANEGDLYAWQLDQDLANPALVVSRLDYTVAVTGVRAAFSSLLQRFALAAKRGTGTVIVRTHPFDTTTLNFGGEAASAIATPSFELCGGNDARVLLAWTDNQNSVTGRLFELLDTPVLRSTMGLGPMGERREPSLCWHPNGGWIVALQAKNAAGKWKAGVCRVYTNAYQSAFATDLGLPQDPRHELQVKVTGESGGYALSFGVDGDPYATRVDELYVRRFLWTAAGSAPTLRDLRNFAPSASLWSYRNDALACDPYNDGLFAAGYTRTNRTSGQDTFFVERLGNTGGSIEIAGIYSANVGSTPHEIAALSLGDAVRRGGSAPRTPHFPLAFATTQSSQPLFIQRFQHGEAQVRIEDNGCGGYYTSAAMPYAGRTGFWVVLDGAQTGNPAFLLLGTNPLSIPLDGLGAPGCTLGVEPTITLPITPTGSSGYCYASFALPDAPVATGDVLVQWLWIETGSGANALGARLSDTLHLEIR